MTAGRSSRCASLLSGMQWVAQKELDDQFAVLDLLSQPAQADLIRVPRRAQVN